MPSAGSEGRDKVSGSGGTGTRSNLNHASHGGMQENIVPQAVIKAVDMSEEMQRAAVEAASNALEKFNMEKDIAASIKKDFDRKYGTTWHCVVGSNFGCFVTHESKHFVYFYLGASAILLFKTV